jgi:hypothetical protein
LIFEKQNYDAETGKFENTGEMVEAPARTVCVAAGTSAERDLRKGKTRNFQTRRMETVFRAAQIREKRRRQISRSGRKRRNRIFHFLRKNGKFISYYGDNHPQYAGNVVKAMASAKHGYEKVVEIFADELTRTRGTLPNRSAMRFSTKLSKRSTNSFALTSSKSNA